MGKYSVAFAALAGVAGSTGVAAAQLGRTGATQSVGPVFRLVGGFLTVLVVGALILALKTRWTRVMTNHLEDNVGKSIVIGLAAALLVGVVAGLLVATGVGAIVGLPLFLVFVAIALVGTAIAGLAIGRGAGAALGIEGEWPALGIGAVSFGVLNAIPILGQLFSLLAGSAGVGIILYRWFGTP